MTTQIVISKCIQLALDFGSTIGKRLQQSVASVSLCFRKVINSIMHIKLSKSFKLFALYSISFVSVSLVAFVASVSYLEVKPIDLQVAYEISIQADVGSRFLHLSFQLLICHPLFVLQIGWSQSRNIVCRSNIKDNINGLVSPIRRT
jgi:hypothetical protein